jgi:hypothetical protein
LFAAAPTLPSALQVNARGCNDTTLHTYTSYGSLSVHLGALERQKRTIVLFGALLKFLLAGQGAHSEGLTRITLAIIMLPGIIKTDTSPRHADIVMERVNVLRPCQQPKEG